MTEHNILPLDTQEATLEMVGGKGRSLAKMANSGFAVPGGFCVTTAAYRRFVQANRLQEEIIALAKPEIAEYTLSFDAASKAIQALFRGPELSDALKAEIRAAYAALGGESPPVAVRSSANAEDLPEMSFAGQQDTYLNIRGEDAVLAAVRDCWASLWTPRAISYRHQMGIEQGSVAMAVVVQLMVPSDVSGILFTANPATGERSEIIINASFGLGEAVVGGQVTPDTYVVDRGTLMTKETILGTKEQKIVSDGEMGTRLVDIDQGDRERSSLSDDALKQLASLALEVEEQFGGVPQDIEWGIFESRLYLLQSRPITNLPPQPIEVDWVPNPPAQILARRQIIENIPDPCTPLFEELYLSEGLETPEKGKKRPSMMVGGGPMFVTLNGYAYQRFDWPQIIEARRQRLSEAMTEAEMDAAEMRVEAEALKNEQAKKEEVAKKQQAEWARRVAEWQEKNAEMAGHDLELFLESLSSADRKAFDEWAESSGIEDLAGAVTQPKSKNPTFGAFNRTQINENQIKGFYDRAKPEYVFYLLTDELKQAIEARKESRAVPEYLERTASRFELREARKRLHPPGTVPFDASEDPSVKFKETQFVNDPSSDTLMGVPVSPGTVAAPASLVNSPAEFDQMRPGSILVCPMTNPAWTPLFAHASGLVTDMGGILGHGSIVAREFGIPAVVGTGTITQRVKHGQNIRVDGDAGIVKLLEQA